MKLIPPTCEELFELVRGFSAVNFKSQEEIKRLRKRVKELEKCLGLDSQNISEPSSGSKKKAKDVPKGKTKKS